MRNYLFNFATTRNPQKIPDGERTRFHVHLNDDDRALTHYWSDLGQDTFAGIIRDILGRTSTMTEKVPILQEINATHELLIALYREVKSEGRRDSLDGLPTFVANLNVDPLTRAERVTLWDAFAYYLWVDPQEEEIALISAIFVADKLLEGLRVALADSLTLTAEDEATLRRISLARVVLPLSIDNRVPQFTRPQQLSAKQRRLLEDAHDQLVASENLLDLERDRDEILEAIVRTRVIRLDAARQTKRDREAELRESLTGRVSAGLIDTLLPKLTTQRDDDETGPVRPEDVEAEIALPRARRLLTRFSRGRHSIGAATAGIDAHIDTQRNTFDGNIQTVYATSFITFGAEITTEEKIPPGTMIVKASRADEGGFHYHLSYFHDQKKPPLGVVSGTITAMGVTSSIQATLLEQSHSGFQTFRLTADPVHGNFADFSLTLVTATITSATATLEPFRVFAAVPHFDVPDLDPFDDILLKPPPLFGINLLGIIDYYRVEQELACYVTGEVSRIENILASEFKERVSRSLSVVESEEEITQEISSVHQTDTETAEKLEMQSEVSSVLREETAKTFDASAGVVAVLGGGNVTLTTNASFNYNSLSAREDSTTEAIELAKTVTNRVQEKLMQKATSRRRSLARREYEDINKHGFDNRLSSDHVVGVYRWLDKIYNNHLVSYGKRNVIEFEIPEPARNFIRAQENTLDEEEFTKHRPPKPSKIGLYGHGSVNRKNYRRFAARYGIDVNPPPVPKITVSHAFAETALGGGEGGETVTSLGRAAAYNEIEVPDGYVAKKAWAQADSVSVLVDGAFATDQWVNVAVGNSGFVKTQYNDETEIDLLPGIDGTVPVGVKANNVFEFVVNVTIECEVHASVYRAWKLSTYNKLIEAYRGLMADYDAAREDHEAEQKKLDLNPRFKGQHMERELKRVCIEMMTKPFINLTISADHYDPAEKGKFYPLHLSPALDRHALVVRFFEQAFDWNLMSYIFYPYFYADPETWSIKVSMEATGNQLFSSFLSAGMGRVMLPIRRGFEEAVMYYLQTGHVWFGGGFVLDVKNDLYLSIADELLPADEVTIKKTWQTKLPTNHTILQSAASALIAEGLPCEIEDNKVGVGKSGLAPVLPPTGPAPG